jgi:probable rRNA maturation factor
MKPLSSHTDANQKRRIPIKHSVEARCGLKRFAIKPKKLTQIVTALLDHLELGSCEVAIEFVGPGRMRSLNRNFRAKDRSTDVLSFPQNNWRRPIQIALKPKTLGQRHKILDNPIISMPLMLGDLVISLPDAEKNAKKIGQGLDREVCFLIVHGLLHLCGHDHMNPKEERLMLQQQEKAMNIILKSVKWQGVASKVHQDLTATRKSSVPPRTNFSSHI